MAAKSAHGRVVAERAVGAEREEVRERGETPESLGRDGFTGGADRKRLDTQGREI